MLSIALIGLSLSMDAFTVSVGAGLSTKDLKFFYALRASLSFGFFQFFMPVAGWYLGETVSSFIEAYDHWIAFALLGFIGGKMIAEGIRAIRRAGPGRGQTPQQAAPGKAPGGQDSGKPAVDMRNPGTLLVLSLATSIDALAVGISLSILDHSIWISAALIGGITFAVCLLGFEAGRRLRQGVGIVLGEWAPIAGGATLVGIGCKILAEHLF
ncbi:MAG: manganese efflux pump MntP family protein [Spirochaetaceae bacterium]|jgi:putative Mn2+ efflux pump MntP|nr:manganese efflux pump MntP family protein [Spirochaetaceae bacterium]